MSSRVNVEIQVFVERESRDKTTHEAKDIWMDMRSERTGDDYVSVRQNTEDPLSFKVVEKMMVTDELTTSYLLDLEEEFAERFGVDRQNVSSTIMVTIPHEVRENE